MFSLPTLCCTDTASTRVTLFALHCMCGCEVNVLQMIEHSVETWREHPVVMVPYMMPEQYEYSLRAK